MKKWIAALAVLTFLVWALCTPRPASKQEWAVWNSAPRTMTIFNEENDRDRFARRMRKLLDEDRFDDLEHVADSLEAADARWASGAPKIATLVQRSFGEVEDPKDPEQWVRRLEQLRTWRDHRPKSRWPDLAIAEALSSRAYEARGKGWGYTVSEDEHHRMVSDLDEARTLLLQSRTARRTGPLWYDAMLDTEHGLGPQGDVRYRALMREAIERYPHYHRFYSKVANHLLPRWYGGPGELAEFGAAVAEALPDSVANEYYARMSAGLVLMYGPAIFEDTGLSWERTRQGLEDWRRRWPASTQPLSLIALMATEADDLPVARSAFRSLGDTLDMAVWKSRPNFQYARQHAFMDSVDTEQKARSRS